METQLCNIKADASQLGATTAERLDALPNIILDGLQTAQATDLHTIREQVLELKSLTKKIPVQHEILKRLAFSSMRSREDKIDPAEAGTFEWMLDDPGANDSEPRGSGAYEQEEVGDGEVGGGGTGSSRAYELEGAGGSKASDSDADRLDAALPKPNIALWLREGGRIFHISGKAGSGKSTLVKFLYSHAKTEENLRKWAGGKKLVKARFYFWSSDKDELQMSLDGLRRSLLLGVLCQCPDLIPDIFPQQWGQWKNGLPSSVAVSDTFPAGIVKGAFDLLVAKQSNPTHRFCFFIDGLDEYTVEDPSDISTAHWEIARDLVNWTKSEDIKICTSARPHTEFLKSFQPHAEIIHLHEFTTSDIFTFSHKTILENPTDVKLEAKFCRDFANEITDKSEGVFLWARLAARHMLDSVGRRDNSDVLFKRLDELPTDLTKLYKMMLGSISEADRPKSDLMLILALENPFDELLNAIVFSWLDDLDDDGFPTKKPLQTLSTNDIKRKHDYVQRQLHSLTKGVLELSPYAGENWYETGPFFHYRVGFFHKTAKDFLESNFDEVLKHHKKRDMVNTFSRLRLAEFQSGMSAMPLSKAYHTQKFLMDTFLPSSGGGIPVDILEGFRIATEAYDLFQRAQFDTEDGVLIDYLWWSGVSIPKTERVSQSWPYYLSLYGQTKGVLYFIDKDPGLLCGQSDRSLILSAMQVHWGIGDITLPDKLIERGVSLTHLITIKYQSKSTKNIPVWLAAIWYTLVTLMDPREQWEVVECRGTTKRAILRSRLEALIRCGADKDTDIVLQDVSCLTPEPPPPPGEDHASTLKRPSEAHEDGEYNDRKTTEYSCPLWSFLEELYKSDPNGSHTKGYDQFKEKGPNNDAKTKEHISSLLMIFEKEITKGSMRYEDPPLLVKWRGFEFSRDWRIREY